MSSAAGDAIDHGSDEQGPVEPLLDQVLAELQRRWNARDATGFAALFLPEADFVDVLGRHLRGREAIARIHQRNFDSIHRGSRLELAALDARRLAAGLVLAHVRAHLSVPAGPLAGDSQATQTLLLERRDGDWRIRAFHNTFVRDLPGAPAAD